MDFAKRLKMIPPYAFAEIEKREVEAIKDGKDIICLGVGDPDGSPPKHIVSRINEFIRSSETNRYPDYDGLFEFRDVASKWCEERFGYTLDAKSEVQALIGAKEGITNLLLAYVNPGDYVLIPDPAYPIYKAGTFFAGGTPYFFPLLEENKYLPDLDQIDKKIAEKAKIMIINYPNNPTGGVADLDFLRMTVEFCKRYNIILCNDAAYTEITFDNYIAPSILQIEGAKDISIEIFSFSKSFNMAGWRIGFAVGNKYIIEGIRKSKVNIDSGQFHPIQIAAKECLLNSTDFTLKLSETYSRRRDILIKGFRELGWRTPVPKATCFVWLPVPGKETTESFTNKLFDVCGISCAPGTSFGKWGEGYSRFSLTASDERIYEAVERMKKNKEVLSLKSYKDMSVV